MNNQFLTAILLFTLPIAAGFKVIERESANDQLVSAKLPEPIVAIDRNEADQRDHAKQLALSITQKQLPQPHPYFTKGD